MNINKFDLFKIIISILLIVTVLISFIFGSNEFENSKLFSWTKYPDMIWAVFLGLVFIAAVKLLFFSGNNDETE